MPLPSSAAVSRDRVTTEVMTRLPLTLSSELSQDLGVSSVNKMGERL